MVPNYKNKNSKFYADYENTKTKIRNFMLTMKIQKQKDKKKFVYFFLAITFKVIFFNGLNLHF